MTFKFNIGDKVELVKHGGYTCNGVQVKVGDVLTISDRSIDGKCIYAFKEDSDNPWVSWYNVEYKFKLAQKKMETNDF